MSRKSVNRSQGPYNFSQTRYERSLRCDSISVDRRNVGGLEGVIATGPFESSTCALSAAQSISLAKYAFDLFD